MMRNGDFTRWLKKQKNRNDGVGDLARDVCEDRGGWHGARSMTGHIDYLCNRGASPLAVTALQAAWGEWSRSG